MEFSALALFIIQRKLRWFKKQKQKLTELHQNKTAPKQNTTKITEELKLKIRRYFWDVYYIYVWWVLSLTVMQTEPHRLLWEMQILSTVVSIHCLLKIDSADVHVLILLQNTVFSCKILLQYFTVPVNFQGTVASFFFCLLLVWYHQRDVTALTLSHWHQPFIQFRTVQNQL